MSAKIPTRQRRILTPTETESMERSIDEEQSMKKETAQFYPGEPVKGSGDDDLTKRQRNVLKQGAAPDLTKHEKVQLEKRSEELKERIQRLMVPRSHVGLRSSKDGVQNYEFRKAVESMSRDEMSPQFQELAQEYKNIMRMLGRPEDANLESIRPDNR